MTEQLSPPVIEYLNQVHLILRVQQTALGMAGMNVGRSRIGVINEISLGALGALMTQEAITRDDLLDRDSHSFLVDERAKLLNHTLVAPAFSPTTKQKELLVPIRVLHLWGGEVVREPHPQGTLEESSIGIATDIVADMLDLLIDNTQARALWMRMKGHTDMLEDYVRLFRWIVDETIRPSGSISADRVESWRAQLRRM
jgi:hypothetical protein